MVGEAYSVRPEETIENEPSDLFFCFGICYFIFQFLKYLKFFNHLFKLTGHTGKIYPFEDGDNFYRQEGPLYCLKQLKMGA